MTGRRALLAVAMAAAVVPYFVGLGGTSIIDANEAFYTETPREMIEAGDCINPTFNYEPRFNKPPLSYWIVAGSYKLFGVSLWSARLPIALGAVVILATVFVLGRLAFSADAGLLAALTLAATPRMLLFSRRIIIDVYTAMFCGLTLLFFALAETRPARRRLWLALMYVAVGLGVLTKGPVSAVVPALAFLAYYALAGRLSEIRRLMLPLGAVILAVIVVPYYAALYGEHGWTYISSFVLTENIGRFAEGAGAPNRGVLFYVPVVLADLYFPWSLLLPAALVIVPWRRARGSFRRPRAAVAAGDAPPGTEASSDLRLLLALWILAFVVFFSLSKAQQDLYVLPFVAGAAPLVGGLLHRWVTGAASPAVLRVARLTWIGLALVLGGLGLLAAWLLGDASRPIHLAGVAPAGALLAAAGVASALLAARRARLAAISVLVATVVAANWLAVVRMLPDYERYKHVPPFARAIEERAGPGAEVCTYKLATPSLVFYLRRHVSMIEDQPAFLQFVNGKAEVYCTMREEEYEAISALPGVRWTRVAEMPVFYTQLQDFWNRPAPRRVLLAAGRSPERP